MGAQVMPVVLGCSKCRYASGGCGVCRAAVSGYRVPHRVVTSAPVPAPKLSSSQRIGKIAVMERYMWDFILVHSPDDAKALGTFLADMHFTWHSTSTQKSIESGALPANDIVLDAAARHKSNAEIWNKIWKLVQNAGLPLAFKLAGVRALINAAVM